MQDLVVTDADGIERVARVIVGGDEVALAHRQPGRRQRRRALLLRAVAADEQRGQQQGAGQKQDGVCALRMFRVNEHGESPYVMNGDTGTPCPVVRVLTCPITARETRAKQVTACRHSPPHPFHRWAHATHSARNHAPSASRAHFVPCAFRPVRIPSRAHSVPCACRPVRIPFHACVVFCAGRDMLPLHERKQAAPWPPVAHRSFQLPGQALSPSLSSTSSISKVRSLPASGWFASSVICSSVTAVILTGMAPPSC